MRVFVISDTHFGMRANSLEWLDVAAGWFRREFIPAARKAARPGDALLHCGDVFDNRQSTNLLVQHEAIGVIEELASVFTGGVHLVAGNHDVMRKNSNDVCALDALKWIPGVRVYKEPEVVDLGGESFLMMPWRSGPDEERACVRAHDARYLVCHTEIRGMKLDRTHVVEGEHLSGADLDKFERVYAGHIHIRQELGNVFMVGNPYQMTRSDLGNEKGWYLLDPASGEHEFVPNGTSPRFVRMRLGDHEDAPMPELVDACRNNRVDLFVPNEYGRGGYAITSVVEALGEHAASLDVVPYDSAARAEPDSPMPEQAADVVALCEGYVATVAEPDDAERITSKIKELYERAVSS